MSSQGKYGNSLSAQVNDAWDSWYAECRKLWAGESESESSAEYAIAFRERGMVSLGHFSSRELSDLVATRFQELGVTGRAVALPKEPDDEITRAIYEVLEAARTRLEACIGSYFAPYWINIEQNHPAENDPTSSHAWHIDDVPRPVAKVFIYLNDVDEVNGAFRAFPRSESQEILASGFMSWTETLRAHFQSSVDTFLQRDPSALVVLEGRAGTVLLFDNNLVHRGTSPQRGYRRVVQIEIFPSSRPFNEADVEAALVRDVKEDFPNDPLIWAATL